MKRSITSLLTLALAACSQTPAAETPDSTASAPTTEAATSPPGATSAAPATSTATAPTIPEQPWFEAVTEVTSGARLFPVDGALLVVEETKPVTGESERTGNRIGVVQGDTVTYPENLFLDGWFHQVVALQGQYPNALHLLAVGDTGRTGVAEHYTFDEKKGWTEKRAMVGSWAVGVARVGRSLVALTAPVMWGPVDLVTLSGPRVKLRPSDVKVCAEDSEARARGSQARLMPAAMVGTSGGDLVAFGNDCLGSAAFEIWKAGEKKSSIVPMGATIAEGTDLSLGVVLKPGSDNDAWLLTDGEHLYHFREGVTTQVALPDAHCSGVEVTRAGALWALCSGRAFEQHEGKWEPRSTPNDAPLEQLVTTADGMMWAVSTGQVFRESMLFLVGTPSKQPAPALATPPMATPQAVAPASAPPPVQAAPPPTQAAPPPAQTRRRLPTPGGPQCSNNVVVLYAFTKTTPKDYDFPLTRKALRGHTEFSDVRFVVTRDVGQRFFAAMVPSYETGKKLKALIAKEVDGSKPQVVCAEPEIEREVTMELGSAVGG